MKKRSFNKKAIFISCIVIMAAAALLFAFFCTQDENAAQIGTPSLSIELPGKLSLSETEELYLDVRISHLGEALYPAASISIGFDATHLEFLGIKEGNLPVLDPERAAGAGGKLPEWSCSTEQSNRSGLINIMYLDLSGGSAAFSRELLEDSEHVIVRLGFRLRGNVRSGDVYELCVEDAVFAASDESMSLAASTGTLKTKNSRIVIGE